MVGHLSLPVHGCKMVWSCPFRFCRPGTPLSYWSANGAGVAAIARAGAVKGCVLGGHLASALTREFGHVKPGGPPVSE